MENINELPAETIKQLLDLYEHLQQERETKFDRSETFDLPEDIFKELEDTTNSELKSKLKKFGRDAPNYNGGRWTQSGAIHKLFSSELKKQQVDATQTINAFYKGTDRLRTSARASTEIYSDLEHILLNGGTEEEMNNLLQKVRRLAIYSFATGKELDQDAKDLATRSIRLPENMHYLRDDEDLAFSSDIVKKTQQSGYEETMVKTAVEDTIIS